MNELGNAVCFFGRVTLCLYDQFGIEHWFGHSEQTWVRGAALTPRLGVLLCVCFLA